MREKMANKISQALLTIRDYYYSKALNQPYSEHKLRLAEQYIDEVCVYIDKKSGDTEREFLFTCFGALDDIKEEGDIYKTALFADAIHRIPLIFCGKEKWNKAFKNKYVVPYCQRYGDEDFSELLDIKITEDYRYVNDKRSAYRFGEMNIMSLPAYFCFRMMIPIILLTFILGALAFVHFCDYTEQNHGERFVISVDSYEYENEGRYDYLDIHCNEYEEPFEISRFFQYSNSPQKVLEICKAGGKLVVYSVYKEVKNRDPYYKIIQLEDTNGTVYRSYEQTNELDKYLIQFLLCAAIVVFVPFFILFVLMLMVALNPKRFASHPKFIKFCFPDYSLNLN
ncbi:MAG: hypothetical protein IJ370_05250 [Oscillospiraceae bacterium]|nr:hypothetical protein [Oscillospiraceae bacterium]